MPESKPGHDTIRIRIPSDVAHAARVHAVTRGMTFEAYYAAAIAAYNERMTKNGKQPTDV